MITFYRVPDCPNCLKIQEILEELAVAHHVIIARSAADLPRDLRHHYGLPLLVDEDEKIQGSRDIVTHLEEVEAFKERWYKFQSDACYCDEKGNVE